MGHEPSNMLSVGEGEWKFWDYADPVRRNAWKEFTVGFFLWKADSAFSPLCHAV